MKIQNPHRDEAACECEHTIIHCRIDHEKLKDCWIQERCSQCDQILRFGLECTGCKYGNTIQWIQHPNGTETELEYVEEEL